MAYDGNDMMNSWERIFGSVITRQFVADCMGMNLRTVDRLISGRRESFPGLDRKVAEKMREIADELLVAAVALEGGGSPSSGGGVPSARVVDIADLEL